MKKQISTFAFGMLTMALIGSLGVGALAAASQFTITVDPINIQINGATFQPKDANGNDVPVFAYNGTTYAPLRALAEAYGLEVGYDQEANMATVSRDGETALQNATTNSETDADDIALVQETITILKSNLKSPSSLIVNQIILFVNLDGQKCVEIDYEATNTFGGYIHNYYTYRRGQTVFFTTDSTVAGNPGIQWREFDKSLVGY